MNTAAPQKTWEATRIQNLLRHKNGRYYARLFLNGKEIWKSLNTAHFSVAEAKMAEVMKEHRERKSRGAEAGDAKLTIGQAAALHMQRLEERVTIKSGTRKYWRETLAALLKAWADLAEKQVRKITPAACREFATRYAKVASSNRFNNTISLLRHIFAVAVESGVLYTNPSDELERVTVKGKTLALPTLAKFGEFVAEMRKAHSRDSKNCADLAEGLAYTGVRIGEAAEISIADLSFENGIVRVKGNPEEGTKNGEVRYVPMIPQARELFSRMLAARPDAKLSDKLFLVRECQKAIDRAARVAKMTRITHHDLRHFFATDCIESGVDIPTVSRWLGHKDGGALAMRTYGHLRREHSVAQAQKVSFTPLVATAA